MKLNIFNNRLLAGLISLAGVFSLVSCDKYLDVRPKSQIPADLLFSRESGFYDQLTGVYSKMAGTNLYGMNLSFGFAELLSQNYDPTVDISSLHYNISRYDYQNTKVKSKIEDIWSDAYNCISNLNLMLEYIDKVDQGIFTGNNYSFYKGEALALRAMLHFDMLRLFAPSYASNPDAPAIPYVEKYTSDITKQYTVKQTMDLIVRDLEQALAYYWEPTGGNYNLAPSKRYRLSIYAIQIMLGRVYLYMGNNDKAYEYVYDYIARDEVVAALPWIYDYLINTDELSTRRTLFDSEIAFYISATDMESLEDQYFNSQANTTSPLNVLSPTDEKVQMIYEVNNSLGEDYRNQKWFDSDGDKRYMSKYWQNSYTKNVIPIIRKSEAYYIAAETLKDSDPERAIGFLNRVRSYRGLNDYPLSTTLTSEQIQSEIYKEYRKEFIGEGQLFYYYKRLNLSTIVGSGVVAGDNVYVLPMPDNEIDYGQRE